jgi:dTDP-glucose pyrophosphorylase
MDGIDRVKVQQLDGFWFDCGTHDDLLECANLVKAIESRTNTTVGFYE